jgi:hypothetical protein
MESTGIHRIPVYEILEQRGFEVILVIARYAKNVPGQDRCQRCYMAMPASFPAHHGLKSPFFTTD